MWKVEGLSCSLEVGGTAHTLTHSQLIWNKSSSRVTFEGAKPRILVEVRTLMRVLSGFVAAIVIPVFLCGLSARQTAAGDRIRVIPNEAANRVDISIDGQPFAAYIWPTKLAKPVLYPLRSAKGTRVTRGYPLEPRPGERVDHPHHVGMWFNYGNASGFDFWNNSEAIKAEDAPKMGNIRHRAITLATGGTEQGELEIDADWITGKGQAILKEHTRFVFRGGPDFRSIDRITTLRAVGEKVVFN